MLRTLQQAARCTLGHTSRTYTSRVSRAKRLRQRAAKSPSSALSKLACDVAELCVRVAKQQDELKKVGEEISAVSARLSTIEVRMSMIEPNHAKIAMEESLKAHGMLESMKTVLTANGRPIGWVDQKKKNWQVGKMIRHCVVDLNIKKAEIFEQFLVDNPSLRAQWPTGADLSKAHRQVSRRHPVVLPPIPASTSPECRKSYELIAKFAAAAEDPSR